MTSKRTQLKKTPIYIFFLKKQIPQNFKKIPLEDFTSYSVSKDDDKVLLNLEKISKLNTLQKNYKLFLIGQALSKYCKSGDFFIDYFGCEQTDVKNFILGWNLANYDFNKFQSKKFQKKIPKIFHEYNNEISLLTESYFFVRDLFLIITSIISYGSKFFTLYLFVIFIYLYNVSFLERLTKSKKIN